MNECLNTRLACNTIIQILFLLSCMYIYCIFYANCGRNNLHDSGATFLLNAVLPTPITPFPFYAPCCALMTSGNI